MTRTKAIAQIQSALRDLSSEQLEALAELAEAWKRPTPTEDEAARAAIAEGLAQADRGEFVSPSEEAQVLNKPWR
jgi:formiminotetrahydrofolate cyclodeaminase